MALVTMAGAWMAYPLPVVVGFAVAASALLLRRPSMLIAGVGVLACGLSAAAWSGLRPPEPRSVHAVATLLTDPKPTAGALTVELRLGRRHVQAWARGGAAGALHDRLAGEVVDVSGTLHSVARSQRLRLAPRHISAELSVTTIEYRSAGSLPARVANDVRRTLLRGVASMAPDHRALFTGFVLGDSRDQSPAIVDAFRGAGLTHLLVVSGENVAFVLLVVGPVLRRLQLRMRFVAGVAVLAGFGVLTRWEPSVLRAVAMAAIAMGATALGRPVSQARLLALAVTALVLVDPLLVHAVGFLLSVGACAGIALFARPLAARIPGPRPLATAAAVTIAAQIGVAPVLIPVFGGLPVAAIPANVLAVPAAGPIMMWGMTAGVVAGVAGGAVAAVLHLPTRLLIAWILAVARAAVRLPLGTIDGPAAVLLGIALVGVWLICHMLGLRSRRALVHRPADP
jgi:competence protein ComEC